MDRQALITNFTLSLPVSYHSESLERLAGVDKAKLRHAAVLIGCVERDDGLNVILTKRAKHLRHHPGQTAFPGGKLEKHDRSPLDAAVRETEEEIGIPADKISLLGQLPELMTISNFLVTPVLAIVDPDYSIRIDKNEVDSVFEVPADHLFDIKQLYSQVFTIRQFSHRVFAIPYREHFIWGVTAQIIQALQLQLKVSDT